MGVDIIVLDHHIADYQSENAIVINNQLSVQYPNKSLSGAGIVYKFCKCYDSLYNYNFADNYLDLVAIALVGDMMDLRDLETHYLVEKGLKSIKNIGLKTLIEKQAYSIGDTNNITPTNIAFYITPLINAIVRVGTREEKEVMFLAFIDGERRVKSTKRGAKEGDTESAAEQTARVSTNARNRQNKIKDKAIEELEYKIIKEDLNNNKILFLQVEDDIAFDNTLTGLVAMQLMHKYKKPVILTRENDDGFLRGSCRGNSDSELKNLKEYLDSTKLFEYTAGHANAFGASLSKESLDTFLEKANDELGSYNFSQNMYEVDFIFNGMEDLATPILELGKFSKLWGQGIEEPYIVVEDMILNKKDFQFMGANKDTCKLTKNGVSFIKFKDSAMVEKLKEFDTIKITVIGKANLNEWCGEITPQIFITDYELSDYTNGF